MVNRAIECSFPDIGVGNAVDLTGKQFGDLTVMYRTIAPHKVTTKEGNAFWMCRCSCGNLDVVRASNLRSGRSTNCTACRSKEMTWIAGKKKIN